MRSKSYSGAAELAARAHVKVVMAQLGVIEYGDARAIGERHIFLAALDRNIDELVERLVNDLVAQSVTFKRDGMGQPPAGGFQWAKYVRQ